MRGKSYLGSLCGIAVFFSIISILGGCASATAENEKMPEVQAAQKSIASPFGQKTGNTQESGNAQQPANAQATVEAQQSENSQQQGNADSPAAYALKGGTWDILQSGEQVYTMADGNSAINVWVEDGGKYYYVDYTGCRMKNNYSPDGFWVGEDGSWVSSVKQRKDNAQPLSGQPYGEGTVMTIDVINYSDNVNYAKATLTYSFGSKEEYNVLPLGNSTYLLEYKNESYYGLIMSVSEDQKTLTVSGLGCTDTYTIGSGDAADKAAASSGPSITDADKDAVIQDFDWFFEDGFPGDGTSIKEIWGLGGMWKSMIYTRAYSGDKQTRRIVISDTDVQYMGYKVTLLFYTKSLYEHPENARENMQLIDNTKATMTMEGDWDEERTSMDVGSVNSELNCKINIFVTKNGFDYALGTVYNENDEIGQVVMIRKTP